MKRAWMLLGLWAAGAAAAAPPDAAAPADPAAQKIVECMRAAVPQHLTVGAFELTTFDRVGGSRTLKGRLFTTRSDSAARSGLMHASLRIEAPAEFKGAAYLVQETDDYLRDGMFVYLPAVKRVRRVTGSFADASLMGTNFSYFDFKQLQHAFGDLSATVEGVEHVNGRPAHVLRFKALPGAETRYTAVKAWIDRDTCVAVRGEFYEGAKLAKELSSPMGSLKQAGKVPYVAEYTMLDPGDKTRTVLKVDKLDSDTQPARRYFEPTAFYLGP
jgi:hypothetical protein